MSLTEDTVNSNIRSFISLSSLQTANQLPYVIWVAFCSLMARFARLYEHLVSSSSFHSTWSALTADALCRGKKSIQRVGVGGCG